MPGTILGLPHVHSQRPSCFETYNTPGAYRLPVLPFADVETEVWNNKWCAPVTQLLTHKAEIQTHVFSLQSLFHYVVCFYLVNDILPCEMQRSAELSEACQDVLGKSICSVTWGSGEVMTTQKRFICIWTPNLARPQSELLKKLNLGFCSSGNCWRLLITWQTSFFPVSKLTENRHKEPGGCVFIVG